MDYDSLTVRHNEERKRFEIDLGDGIALADYTLPQGKIMFTHTEVPTRHERRGLGTKLVLAGLDHARANGLAVIPACALFAHYMKVHPEVQDLLDPTYRKVLGLA